MIRALTLVCVGALSFAGVYLWAGSGRDAPAPLVTASIDAAPALAEAVRDEGPVGETVTARSAEPAQPPEPAMVAAVEPASSSPDEPAIASAGAPRLERLFNPIFVGAGTIQIRDRQIRLAGIDAPAFDATCGEGETAWPCGRMARSALQRFVRGRAIECEVPASADAVPDRARCSIAGDDIAAWLVTQGWAKRTGDTYAAEERRAHDAAIGLWGSDRPDRQALAATDG